MTPPTNHFGPPDEPKIATPPLVLSRTRSNYAHHLGEFPGIAFPDDAAFQFRSLWGEHFRERIGPGFDGRVVLEVGCFDAVYLARLAAKHPRTGFVGLDWKCKAICLGAERVARLDLRNVALLRARAQDVRHLFGPRELDEAWVFHPDPCDKPGETENRLIAEPFLVDLHGVLREGGKLCLKTDHPGYYQWVLGLFGLSQPEWFHAPRDATKDVTAAVPRVRWRDVLPAASIPKPSEAVLSRYRVAANSADFWNDAAALAHTASRCFAGGPTPYEARFSAKGLPIYYVEIIALR